MSIIRVQMRNEETKYDKEETDRCGIVNPLFRRMIIRDIVRRLEGN